VRALSIKTDMKFVQKYNF